MLAGALSLFFWGNFAHTSRINFHVSWRRLFFLSLFFIPISRQILNRTNIPSANSTSRYNGPP